MKRLKLLFLLSGLILFSCNKTEDTLPKDPQNKDPLAGFDTRSVSVNFPSSSQLDLAEAQLLCIQKFNDELDSRRNVYNSLEVTVIPK